MHTGVALGKVQKFPQIPQFFGSCGGSAHYVAALSLSQVVKLFGHRNDQTPSEQTYSGPHTFPRPPQFFGSLAVAAQYDAPVWSHRVRFSPQVKVQTPSEQNRPGSQACPQLPQWSLSCTVSTHEIGSPAHAVNPSGHAQSPFSEIKPALHEIAHPPQLLGS